MRGLRNYWEATHDENIRDAVIFAGKSFEWRAGLLNGKYTGFSLTKKQVAEIAKAFPR